MTTEAPLLASAPLWHHSRLPPELCHNTQPHHFSSPSPPKLRMNRNRKLVLGCCLDFILTFQASINLQDPCLAYAKVFVCDVRLMFPDTRLHINCSLSFAGVSVSVRATHWLQTLQAI